MSETERYVGEIIEIAMPENNSWIENVKQLQKEGNCIEWIDEDDKYFDSEDVVYLNGKFYKIIKKESHEDWEDIFDAKKEPSGSITFTVKYYNGGCGFHEALETALKNNNL